MQLQTEKTSLAHETAASQPTGQMLLEAAVAYMEATPGSQFRARLTSSASHAMGLTVPLQSRLGKGIEAFHIASLILDDLPCMDDADERRGRTTLHVAFSEQTAILAAMEFINRGYTICWEASLGGQQPMKVLKFLRQRMGTLGILGGQARDLQYEGSRGAREVRAIAIRKTGALLELSLVLPALLGGAGWREVLALGRLARQWGMIYQGIDDFKDLRLTEVSDGKTAFRDLELTRPNLVLSVGRHRAAREILDRLAYASRLSAGLVSTRREWSCLNGFQFRLEAAAKDIRDLVEAA